MNETKPRFTLHVEDGSALVLRHRMPGIDEREQDKALDIQRATRRKRNGRA